MEELCWERNVSFPWSNFEDNIGFGSENIFLNPVQDVQETGSTICSSPVTAATGRQAGSHRQLAPARLDSINVASSFGSASQYWRQTLAVNDLHEGKTVTPLPTTAAAGVTVTSLESLDCFLSAANSNTYTSPHHEDDISVIFSDYKNLNLCSKAIKNLSGVSSESDGGIVSQCSSEKKPTNSSGFYEDNPPRSKRPRSDPVQSTSSTISFRQATESDETDSEAITQMKEMIYRTAAFRPVSFADEEVVEKSRRRNVRISSDPQTVAARKRRERISERIRVLQKLVPGGSKMDTASMLDEAANYLKFLRSQVKASEQFGQCGTTTNAQGTTQNIIQNVTLGVPWVTFPMQTPFLLPYQQIYPTLPPA